MKTVSMTIDKLSAVREAVADYMRSEGCSCCRNQDAHDEAEKKLAELLRVPKYKDGSGYDFNRFSTY